MSDMLLLFSAVDMPQIARWATVSLDGSAVIDGGPGVPNTRSLAQIDRSVLIVSGTNVAAHTLELPKRITASVLSALPQLLEDQLADPDRDVHCAVSSRAGPERTVAVIDKVWFKAILDQLKQASIFPDLAVPDYMLGSCSDVEARIYKADKVVTVCLPGGMGCSVEPDALAMVLPGALSQDIKRCICFGLLSEAERQSIPPTVDVRVEASEPEDSRTLRFARAAANYNWLNLLQGRFRPPRNRRFSLPSWRRTTSLAVVASVLALFAFAADAWRMNQQAAAIDKAALTSMQELFPGVRNVSHFRAKIRELGAEGEDLFLIWSRLLIQHTASGQGLRIKQIQFDNLANEMLIKLEARSLEDAEQLRLAISSAPGVQAVDRGARQQGAAFTVDIVLAQEA